MIIFFRIHHESEKRGKSSALPLKVLADEDVEVIGYPTQKVNPLELFF